MVQQFERPSPSREMNLDEVIRAIVCGRTLAPLEIMLDINESRHKLEKKNSKGRTGGEKAATKAGRCSKTAQGYLQG